MSTPNGTAAQAKVAVYFRDVPGFPGYRVGDDGSVWSRRRGNRWGVHYRGPWKRLKPKRGDRYGHLAVELRSDDGPHSRYVHRLVLGAFVGPCPPGMECCHGNGNPRDNRLTNLRWDTPSANSADKKAHGTLQDARGERNSRAKLSLADVFAIRSLAGKLSSGKIGARFGVCGSTVRRIISGKDWTHLPPR